MNYEQPAYSINYCLKHYGEVKPPFKMWIHLVANRFKWETFELTQLQCRQLGFLTDRSGYQHNTLVQRCGDVIRFTQNLIGDESCPVKYRFIPK